MSPLEVPVVRRPTEVCAAALDAQGSTVAQEFSERSIAISGAALHPVDDVIAVAGQDEVTGVRSVVLGGHATALITDTAPAAGLLEAS